MTLPEYPDTRGWPAERWLAHVVDAHEHKPLFPSVVMDMRAWHDEDHRRGANGGIPHTHAEPKLTAEQAIAEIRKDVERTRGNSVSDHIRLNILARTVA